MYSRRFFFGLAAFGSARAAEHWSYINNFVYNDGSRIMERKGYKNGYPYESVLRVKADELTVVSYEVKIRPRKTMSVYELLLACREEPVVLNSFGLNTWLNGQKYISRLSNVEAGFEFYLAEVLVFSGNCETILVQPTQQLKLKANLNSPAKLVAD